MATKRIRRVTEYEDGADVEREPEALPSLDVAEESYSGFVGKFAHDDVKVKVYRQTPQGAQYCFFGGPSDIDEETIRQYHAKQTYAHEAAVYQLRVFVHGEQRNVFPVPIAPQVAMPLQASGSSGSGDIMLVQLLRDQNERLERRIEEMSRREREPIGELAAAMKTMHEISGNGSQQQMPMDTLIKAIELGKTLADGGASDWKMQLLDVCKEALPAVRDIFSAIATRPQPKPKVAGMDGVSPPQEPPRTALEEPNDMDNEFLLKQAIQFLKKKCLTGSNPELYVAFVCDNCEENALYQALLHRILNREFSEFAAIDPEISTEPYAAFFRSIYDGLRQAFKEQNPVDDDSDRPSGNAPNPASNGDARKTSRKRS